MEYVIDKKESDQIRILRIICALLVVAIHAGTFFDVYKNPPALVVSIKTIIYICFARAAVPTFFIISSILLYRKKYNYFENLKKKSISLLIPYFLINGFWILFLYIIQKNPFIASQFAEASIIDNLGPAMLLDKFGFAGNHPICGVLWFVRNLFVLNVLAPIIKKVIDKFPYIIFVIIAFWLFIPTEPSNIYIYIYPSYYLLQSITFWCLGYYFVKYNIHLSIFNKHYVKTFICLFILSLLYKFCPVLPLDRLIVLISIVFVISMSSLLVENKFLLKLSEYNMVIYEFHLPTGMYLEGILARVLPQTVLNFILIYFGTSTLITILCILFGYILKRYLPRAYKVITGSR